MKTLNFKKWLKSQNVDTKYFWGQCKKKNQQWGNNSNNANDRHTIPRKSIKLQPSASFITIAFNWEEAEKGYSYWDNLDIEWRDTVSNHEGPVEFGFE